MASPSRGTVLYGGNTACLDITSGKTRIICDAGTGIRPLGIELGRRAKGRPIEAWILLSHLHWDHYIGLPFFKPLFERRNRFVLGGPGTSGMGFGAALSRAMRPPYFPIPISEIPSILRFKTIAERPFDVGGVRVVPHAVNHPGGALGWRFNFPDGKSLVHITDNEPADEAGAEKLIEWMGGADVLIHDAQYTPKNYARKRGWGHSPYTYPIWLAAKAGVPRLFLFHFDPEDDDRHLTGVLGMARSLIRRRKLGVACSLAREGTTIAL